MTQAEQQDAQVRGCCATAAAAAATAVGAAVAVGEKSCCGLAIPVSEHGVGGSRARQAKVKSQSAGSTLLL